MQPFPHAKYLIWIKIAFSGQHWTGRSIEKCEKKFGCDKKINFRNESVKKNQQFMSNSSLQFIFFKMSINNPLKWKISTKISIVFPGLEPILYAGQKLWLTAKFFRKLFLVVDCPTKNIKKLVEKTFRKKAENNWNKLVFLKNLLF